MSSKLKFLLLIAAATFSCLAGLAAGQLVIGGLIAGFLLGVLPAYAAISFAIVAATVFGISILIYHSPHGDLPVPLNAALGAFVMFVPIVSAVLLAKIVGWLLKTSRGHSHWCR